MERRLRLRQSRDGRHTLSFGRHASAALTHAVGDSELFRHVGK